MSDTDQLMFQLERLILDRTYAPGDRLPPERELCKQFGASRGKVREAITKLEAMGFVRTAPQSGTYVCDYQREASFDLLLYLMEHNEELDPEVYHSMMEFREVMELFAIQSLYRQKASADQERSALARKLEAITAKLESVSPEDITAIISLDFQFHEALVHASGNLIFKTLYMTSKQVHSMYTNIFYQQPKVFPMTIIQQQALITALREGSCMEAEAALRVMLHYGDEQVFMLLKNQRAWIQTQ